MENQLIENQRIVSYQQASEELRDNLIKLYNKKIFPRMGKIFADQLFTSGIEAGGFLSALSDIDEIHVKRDIAQSALVRLKRSEYILKTMIASRFYTAKEAEDLQVFFNKIIPAVRALLVEVYEFIQRENAEIYGRNPQNYSSDSYKDEATYEHAIVSVPETIPEHIERIVSGDNEDHDPDGFYQHV